jgi:CheY-like chemotaxis protein
MKILIVDDIGDNYLLLKEAFDRVIAAELVYLKDGQSAVDHLKSLIAQGLKLPDAIIIGINMPRLDGIEILKRIKLTPMLFSIPVIMHSSSFAHRYRCLTLGADAFICKGNSVEETTLFVRNVVLLVLKSSLAHKELRT